MSFKQQGSTAIVGVQTYFFIHSWGKMRRSGYDFLISLRENITLSAGGLRASSNSGLQDAGYKGVVTGRDELSLCS